MKRFLVEWHEASGIPDDMPAITPRESASPLSAPARPASPSRASWRVGPPGRPSSTSCPTAAARCSSACPRSACRAKPSRWTSGSSSGWASSSATTRPYRARHHLRASSRSDFDAVAISAGAMDPVALDVPGADLDGVQYGVDFMKKANLGQPLEVGKDVVVIGGGYTAMDCSRTSLRHGAENVTIAYRRTRSELVVDEEELGETEREGVRMEFLASPIEVLGEDGKVTGVKFIRNKLGEPDASGRRAPGPDRGLRVHRQGRHGHPGRVPGGRPHLPAGRVELRGQPRPGQGRPGDVRHERPRRVRLRRLRDRPDDAHRGRRPRQEVRLRGRPLPRRPDRRDRRRQREHHQLVAPRDARALRRPAAPARPDGPAPRADAVDRSRP